jgi:hypothetical protein
VTSDVRSHYMRQIKSLSVTSVLSLLYPRLLAIHDLTDDIGFPGGSNGRLRLPRCMRASHAFMVTEGAYLMSECRWSLSSDGTVILRQAWSGVDVMLMIQPMGR